VVVVVVSSPSRRLLRNLLRNQRLLRTLLNHRRAACLQVEGELAAGELAEGDGPADVEGFGAAEVLELGGRGDQDGGYDGHQNGGYQNGPGQP